MSTFSSPEPARDAESVAASDADTQALIHALNDRIEDLERALGAHHRGLDHCPLCELDHCPLCEEEFEEKAAAYICLDGEGGACGMDDCPRCNPGGLRTRRTRPCVLAALEASLAEIGGAPGVLAETARAVAMAIDEGPTPQELAKLSLELRQLLKDIRAQSRPQTTELDTILDRLRATEFDV